MLFSQNKLPVVLLGNIFKFEDENYITCEGAQVWISRQCKLDLCWRYVVHSPAFSWIKDHHLWRRKGACLWHDQWWWHGSISLIHMQNVLLLCLLKNCPLIIRSIYISKLCKLLNFLNFYCLFGTYSTPFKHSHRLSLDW